MRQQLLVLLALLGVSMAISNVVFQNNTQVYNSTQLYNMFTKFKAQYKKFYNVNEEVKRLNVFINNLQVVDRLNSLEEGTAEYGVTQYSDMTTEEFTSKILMPSSAPRNFSSSKYLGFKKRSTDAPTAFDWRDYGAVTPVKDQGTVGTCWTFSTTGNIEGQHFLAGNNLTSLSEEQIVDCDGSQDIATNHADCGVFGGWPYLAFEYVIKAGGLPSEDAYPYCVGKGYCYPCPAQGYNATLCGPPEPYCNATTAPCRQGTLPITAQIEDWKALSTDEDTIKQQLHEIGPLSVALDATFLQFYKKGISAPKLCSKKQLNHAVLMVGYGNESNTDFWTIKNSWGADWGEKGYFRIKRGTGQCGINTQVATSVIDKAQHEFDYMVYEDYEIAF